MKNKKIMLLVIFVLILVIAIGCTKKPVKEPELNPEENVVVEDDTPLNNVEEDVRMDEETTPPMENNDMNPDTNPDTNQ